MASSWWRPEDRDLSTSVEMTTQTGASTLVISTEAKRSGEISMLIRCAARQPALAGRLLANLLSANLPRLVHQRAAVRIPRRPDAGEREVEALVVLVAQRAQG
jgi:hypothetical protein